MDGYFSKASLAARIPDFVSNAIKLAKYFQAGIKKDLDKSEKMCGKALKTSLIFRGLTNEVHSRSVEGIAAIHD